MNDHRQAFVINEKPLNVILLDHVVRYYRNGINDPWFTIVLSNGHSISILLERLPDFEEALYGRV